MPNFKIVVDASNTEIATLMKAFIASELCETIQVTEDASPASNSEGGLYDLSDKRASAAPNSPVWKKSGGNRFIFNTGTSLGWRIGQELSLTTGGYFCKSKHILMIFTIHPILLLKITLMFCHMSRLVT